MPPQAIDRETLLRTATARLIEEYDRWQRAEEVHVTDRLARTIDDTLLLWSYGDLPGNCRELAKRIEALEQQWQKHQNTTAVSGQPPSRDFWRAFAAVQEGAAVPAVRKFKPLEPIARLIDQEVSRDQICRMYGFCDAHGNADFQMLEEEIAEPGKHTGPGTGWLPPLEKRRQEEEQRKVAVQRRVAARLDRLEAAAAAGDAAGLGSGREAAGETDVALMDEEEVPPDPLAAGQADDYAAIEETIAAEAQETPARRRKK